MRKRHTKLLEHDKRLFVSIRSGNDGNVHAAQFYDLIVIDLGENQLIPEAKIVIAASSKDVLETP